MRTLTSTEIGRIIRMDLEMQMMDTGQVGPSENFHYNCENMAYDLYVSSQVKDMSTYIFCIKYQDNDQTLIFNFHVVWR